MATLTINADGTFTITGKLDDMPRPSSTGKTLVVGGSGGFVKTGAVAHDSQVSMNLSLTIPNPDAPKAGK